MLLFSPINLQTFHTQPLESHRGRQQRGYARVASMQANSSGPHFASLRLSGEDVHARL